MSSFSKRVNEQKGKTLDWFTDTKATVANAVREKMDTVTGKAVLEEIAKFSQETEAVNTALVNHVYQLHEQQANLDTTLRNQQAYFEQYSLRQAQRIKMLTTWIVVIGFGGVSCLVGLLLLIVKVMK